MASFPNKPLVITVEQYIDPPGLLRDENNRPYITIHKQRFYIEKDDLIVVELDGIHYYPRRPSIDIFEKRYELLMR